MANATSHLALLYSGGAGNSSPAFSIGGAASTTPARYIHSQTFTPSTISGLEITHAARNPDGVGSLSFVAANKSVVWQNPLGVSTTLALDLSQEWAAVGSTTTGFLRLRVSPEMLPVTDAVQAITVAQANHTLFGAPASNEITAGLTDYRCLYLWNQSPVALSSVNLVLTDMAPASAVQIGSTFNSISQYKTTSADGLDFGTIHPLGSVAPYTVSLAGGFRRERLEAKTRAGTPTMAFFPPDYGQDSDGATKDVDVLLADSLDSTNKLSAVLWGTSLYWGTIGAGRMVSLWVKRALPPNPTLPVTETILFDITFTT
mgnify:CR=1 FL=1